MNFSALDVIIGKVIGLLLLSKFYVLIKLAQFILLCHKETLDNRMLNLQSHVWNYFNEKMR